VMVVDATMARLFWAGADPIGQCVRVGADTMPCSTVVGVVEDSRRGIAERAHSLRYYLPLPQTPAPDAERYLFARTRGEPGALLGPVRAAVAAVSPPGRAVEVFPMRRLLDWQMRPWRLGAAVLVAFGALSTVIAAVGLYGIIAFGVARRERELGVRLALGAPRGAVVRDVVREAWGRAALAVVMGAVAALLVGRRLRELLFGTTETDAVVYAAVAALMLVTAAAASAVPAWRAARVDPARSLRAD
jgi:putative ABC transport system permease protein